MRQAMLAVVVLAAAVLVSVTSAGATSGSGRNGRVLYSETTPYSYGSGSLYAINPNGSGRVLVANNAVNGSWSPDGKRILFETARKGDLDLWTVKADGSSPKELTFSVGVDQDGAWSPDGSQIAFESNRNNPSGMDVFVMNADGTQPKRLTDATGFNGDPTWSPDGKSIAFTSTRGGSKDIWVINADGSGLQQVTGDRGTEENPAWSPDGGLILYDSDDGEPGNLDIWVVSSNGANPRRLISSPALDALPEWSPDAKQIAFASERTAKGSRKIYVANANGSNVHLLSGPSRRGTMATLPSMGSHPAGDSCMIEGTVHADRPHRHARRGRDLRRRRQRRDLRARRRSRRRRRRPGRDTAHVDSATSCATWRRCCTASPGRRTRPKCELVGDHTDASRSKTSTISGSFPISSRARDGSGCSAASADSNT